mmetsp:Transcript_47953/g.57807  ORF Transcript_47953/g.57807 Transcript_47953/m.57807 type:complete len:237 (-) Transcript_47953:88-798(-)
MISGMAMSMVGFVMVVGVVDVGTVSVSVCLFVAAMRASRTLVSEACISIMTSGMAIATSTSISGVVTPSSVNGSTGAGTSLLATQAVKSSTVVGMVDTSSVDGSNDCGSGSSLLATQLVKYSSNAVTNASAFSNNPFRAFSAPFNPDGTGNNGVEGALGSIAKGVTCDPLSVTNLAFSDSGNVSINTSDWSIPSLSNFTTSGEGCWKFVETSSRIWVGVGSNSDAPLAIDAITVGN